MPDPEGKIILTKIPANSVFPAGAMSRYSTYVDVALSPEEVILQFAEKGVGADMHTAPVAFARIYLSIEHARRFADALQRTLAGEAKLRAALAAEEAKERGS